MEFSLRPASEQDREFLYALHSRTMREVIERTWGWDETWQQRDFDRRFREHQVSIIESEDRAVGGVMFESKPDSIYIHELQVLSEYQGRGIGTRVVGSVIERAAACGLHVTLSVVPANTRARNLYERLGFEVTAMEAPFIRMRHIGRVAGAK
jgi:ribosomal protein S18 acetylase RimI-like enzyme